MVRQGYSYHFEHLIAFNDNLYLSGKKGIYRYDGEKFHTVKEFTVIESSGTVLGTVAQCFIFQDSLYFLIKGDGLVNGRIDFDKTSLWISCGDTLKRVADAPPLKACFEYEGVLYAEKEGALYRFTSAAFERISHAGSWGKSVPHKGELVFISNDSLSVLRNGKAQKVSFTGKPPRFFEDLIINGEICYALGKAVDGTAQFWKYGNGKATRVSDPSAQTLALVWSLTSYKNKLFFSASKKIHGTVRSLFMFDGNAITEVLPGKNAATLFVFKESLFFTAQSRPLSGRALYQYYEGTAERVSPNDALWDFVGQPFSFKDELYFIARDEEAGARIWKYDGKKTLPVIQTITH